MDIDFTHWTVATFTEAERIAVKGLLGRLARTYTMPGDEEATQAIRRVFSPVHEQEEVA